MTYFQVSPNSIDKYGTLIGRASNAADKAKDYLRGHDPDIGGFFGKILQLFFPSHNALVDATNKMLGHLAAIGSESDLSLKKTANYYRHTEQSVVARVDASYPGALSKLSQRDLTESRYEELTGRSLATYNFADVVDASSALKEPESAELSAFESL